MLAFGEKAVRVVELCHAPISEAYVATAGSRRQTEYGQSTGSAVRGRRGALPLAALSLGAFVSRPVMLRSFTLSLFPAVLVIALLLALTLLTCLGLFLLALFFLLLTLFFLFALLVFLMGLLCCFISSLLFSGSLSRLLAEIVRVVVLPVSVTAGVFGRPERPAGQFINRVLSVVGATLSKSARKRRI